jgi:hypothetical protein
MGALLLGEDVGLGACVVVVLDAVVEVVLVGACVVVLLVVLAVVLVVVLAVVLVVVLDVVLVGACVVVLLDVVEVDVEVGLGAAGARSSYMKTELACTLTTSPGASSPTTYEPPAPRVASWRCTASWGSPASTRAEPARTSTVHPFAAAPGA